MKHILFVCLGNICRSPAAEGVMNHLLARKGLSKKYRVDSAGTAGWHVGELPDGRMRHAAGKRGYELTSRGRQFDPRRDFEKFDVIVAMDDENLREIRAKDPENRYGHKIFKMTDFCRKHQEMEVPDPYYGGQKGFEKVLDILEDACEGLLEWLENGHEFNNHRGN